MSGDLHKKDGLCSLTAQKITDDKIFTDAPGRNHPDYPAEEYCETERIEPHRVKIPYPGDSNLKKLTKDIKMSHKSGAQLKNNEYGKIWTSMQNRRDENISNMDEDLATKLKERSKRTEQPNVDDSPAPPPFARVQLRQTGSKELLDSEPALPE